jgi:hypothetical protein
MGKFFEWYFVRLPIKYMLVRFLMFLDSKKKDEPMDEDAEKK